MDSPHIEQRKTTQSNVKETVGPSLPRYREHAHMTKEAKAMQQMHGQFTLGDTLGFFAMFTFAVGAAFVMTTIFIPTYAREWFGIEMDLRKTRGAVTVANAHPADAKADCLLDSQRSPLQPYVDAPHCMGDKSVSQKKRIAALWTSAPAEAKREEAAGEGADAASIASSVGPSFLPRHGYVASNVGGERFVSPPIASEGAAKGNGNGRRKAVKGRCVATTDGVANSAKYACFPIASRCSRAVVDMATNANNHSDGADTNNYIAINETVVARISRMMDALLLLSKRYRDKEEKIGSAEEEKEVSTDKNSMNTNTKKAHNPSSHPPLIFGDNRDEERLVEVHQGMASLWGSNASQCAAHGHDACHHEHQQQGPIRTRRGSRFVSASMAIADVIDTAYIDNMLLKRKEAVAQRRCDEDDEERNASESNATLEGDTRVAPQREKATVSSNSTNAIEGIAPGDLAFLWRIVKQIEQHVSEYLFCDRKGGAVSGRESSSRGGGEHLGSMCKSIADRKAAHAKGAKTLYYALPSFYSRIDAMDGGGDADDGVANAKKASSPQSHSSLPPFERFPYDILQVDGNTHRAHGVTTMLFLDTWAGRDADEAGKGRSQHDDIGTLVGDSPSFDDVVKDYIREGNRYQTERSDEVSEEGGGIVGEDASKTRSASPLSSSNSSSSSFYGGSVEFLSNYDAETHVDDSLSIEPRRGRLLMFTSGAENAFRRTRVISSSSPHHHQSLPLPSLRVLTTAFTCDATIGVKLGRTYEESTLYKVIDAALRHDAEHSLRTKRAQQSAEAEERRQETERANKRKKKQSSSSSSSPPSPYSDDNVDDDIYLPEEDEQAPLSNPPDDLASPSSDRMRPAPHTDDEDDDGDDIVLEDDGSVTYK